jgi:hypothetical protein
MLNVVEIECPPELLIGLHTNAVNNEGRTTFSLRDIQCAT